MSEPRFNVGDRVTTLRELPPTHVRLPGYLCGKVGVVVRRCGCFPIADERALGITDARVEDVYSVEFEAADIFAHVTHRIVADLWESYLRSAV